MDVATFGVSALARPNEVHVTTLETFDTSLGTDQGRRAAALWHAFERRGSVFAAAKHGSWTTAPTGGLGFVDDPFSLPMPRSARI